MCAGKNLLVQCFRLLELPLFQITGSLQENTVLSECLHREAGVDFHLQKNHCPSAIPGYFSSWPHWDHQVPASSGRSPGPSGSSTLPPHTCPGSGTVRPSYSAVWQRQDDPFPEPGVRDSASETPPSTHYEPPAKVRDLLKHDLPCSMYTQKTLQNAHARPQRSGWSR